MTVSRENIIDICVYDAVLNYNPIKHETVYLVELC